MGATTSESMPILGLYTCNGIAGLSHPVSWSTHLHVGLPAEMSLHLHSGTLPMPGTSQTMQLYELMHAHAERLGY